MPNRTRKRAARFDEESFREDELYAARRRSSNAANKRPKVEVPPKTIGKKQPSKPMSKPWAFNTTWTPEEDQQLKEIVDNLPSNSTRKHISWVDVADRMGAGRTAKQVRDRWTNSLHPGLKKKGAPWSEREMATLIRLQHKWGNSWAKISQKMTNCGRSHNDLKNKWNSLMKNQQFALAYNARQTEEAMAKKSKGGNDNGKVSGMSKGSIATFAATMARKLCARSNYNRNDEDEDLDATSEESDAESDDEENPSDNVVEVEKQKKAKATKQIKESKTKKGGKATTVKKGGDCEMTEDGGGHLLTDVEQSESQLEFGRRLQQYKWAVVQEKKIELFRRGRLDSGLTCRDVDELKLMGLGLGIDALKKKYFGSAENPEEEANLE